VKPLVVVHGTWSRFKDWHEVGSPLRKALQDHDFEVYDFLWSGYCGGFPSPVIVPKDSPEMDGRVMLWCSEGEKLALWCIDRGLESPDLLTHSHGLQVGVFAASAGQSFDHFLSISGPIRSDMAKYRQLARPNIRKWTQVVDPDDDMTIREGQAFDHHLGWAYDLPEGDLTINTPGYGHSGLVLDPTDWGKLKLWEALGVWLV